MNRGDMLNKTIGILAHVDAGKTTFSEQLLFIQKQLNKEDVSIIKMRFSIVMK